MNDFVSGAATMAACVVAMFLFKFWRESRDRLLLLFSLAFVVLGLNWGLLSLIHPGRETRHLFYLLRLLAFLLFLVAIWDKNRRGRSP